MTERETENAKGADSMPHEDDLKYDDSAEEELLTALLLWIKILTLKNWE